MNEMRCDVEEQSFIKTLIPSKDGKLISVVLQTFQAYQESYLVVIVDGATTFHAGALQYLLAFNIHEMSSFGSTLTPCCEASISGPYGMVNTIFNNPWIEIPLMIQGVDHILPAWHHLSAKELLNFLNSHLPSEE